MNLCSVCRLTFRPVRKGQVYCSLACSYARPLEASQEARRVSEARCAAELRDDPKEVPTVETVTAPVIPACPCGCGKPVPPKNKFAGIGCNVRYLNQQRRAGKAPYPQTARKSATGRQVPEEEDPPVPRGGFVTRRESPPVTVPAVISFLAQLPEAEAAALLTVAGMMRRQGA